MFIQLSSHRGLFNGAVVRRFAVGPVARYNGSL
ncbi:hypothetical protein SAMN06295955_10475 [Sphingopyxis indica]|uniref:Uncharacterized protein n=1 Tax=Sphingopyxis indica TaxID=436663 RepID=A0A239GSG9_9SPHN|nr:hypothetical protein SAMN06295955_10475 [Sphingopyxis indica]